MMVRGLTEVQVRQAVKAAGLRFRKPPGWYGQPGSKSAFISFTIQARSRETRHRGYANLCAKIFELNPQAEIPPCYCGTTLLYPVGVGAVPSLEGPTITPEQTLAAAGVDAGQWAEYNRRYCALLGGVK
jgi:hypothetical protein